MRKNYRELLKHLPAGYTIDFPRVDGSGPRDRARIRGTHPCIICPDGTPFRDGEGRMFHVSSSPNRSALRSDIRRVQDAFRLIAGEGDTSVATG